MEVAFGEDDLQELENNPDAKSQLSKLVIKAYRERMRCIRDAFNEHDLICMKSFGFKKLQGGKKNHYSLSLIDGWYLIIRLDMKENGNVIQILEIQEKRKRTN